MAAKPYPELTWMQYRALFLVNERAVATDKQIAHLLFANQTARPRAEQLLDELCELGLLWNRGHFTNYQYCTTEAGDDYLENALRPIKPLKLLT